MAVKRKDSRTRSVLCFFVLIFWMGTAYLSVSECSASKMEIHVGINDVSVIANESRLIDILNELSRKAEFLLLSDIPLDEIVSMNIRTTTVEDCLRKLISSKNHVMYYQRRTDSTVALTELKVIGGQQRKSNSPSASTPEETNSQIRVDPDWYVNAISDMTTFSKQIKTKMASIPDGAELPEQKGIQVTDVAPDSFFGKIGISKGDILVDVNGRGVASPQAFIGALMWSRGSPTAMRIERLKQNGQIDPVYFYIEQN